MVTQFIIMVTIRPRDTSPHSTEPKALHHAKRHPLHSTSSATRRPLPRPTATRNSHEEKLPQQRPHRVPLSLSPAPRACHPSSTLISQHVTPAQPPARALDPSTSLRWRFWHHKSTQGTSQAARTPRGDATHDATKKPRPAPQHLQSPPCVCCGAGRRVSAARPPKFSAKNSFLSKATLRVGAGNDLGDLLRDGRLPLAVQLEGQGLHQVRGVVRGGLHRRHAGGELGGDRLLHLAEELAVEVEGEDGREDLLGVLLEDHVLGEVLGLGGLGDARLDGELAVLGGHGEDLVTLGLDTGGGEGEHGADRGLRRDERGEASVGELHAVSLTREVGREDVVSDGRGLLGVGGVADGVALDDVVALAKVLRPLVADADHVEVEALRLELLDALLRLLDGVRVVAAAQPAVAGEGDEEHLVDGALGEEGRVKVVLLEALDEPPEHLLQGLGEGAGLEHGVLGAAHLGGGDELHGGGDLLGVLDRVDPLAQLLDRGHHGTDRPALGPTGTAQRRPSERAGREAGGHERGSHADAQGERNDCARKDSHFFRR
mmetsp:Transcript_14435/g.28506  ORF Transcript_14435/g.28506 Transcript_14435/m.28506 type:complete len:545 (-) Transcript_14435:28-1662(-)